GTGSAEPPAAISSTTPAALNPVESTEAGGDQTFHRYYHLYRNGELEADIEAAGGVVLESGYEKDNWWAIAGRNPP
ncbi:tRNA methyltransferase, has a role in tRNA modification, partial [Cryomyces antarcticus]